MRSLRLDALAALVACLAAGAATAQAPGYGLQTIYVNSPGHPTNTVPGLGVPFRTGGGSEAAVGRPWFSSNGTQWVVEAWAQTATTSDNIYIRNNTLLLQEGVQAPWAPPGETASAMDNRVAINNTGAVVVTHNTAGTAPTTADDYVVLMAPGGVNLVLAKEGELVDPVLPALAGATWDDALTTAILTDTGLVGWEADAVDNLASGTAADEFVVLGNTILVREGDVPINQAGGGTAAWENFNLDEVYVSPDGSVRVVLGDTNAATTEDQILTINGAVVLQEGHVVPGSSFTQPIDATGIVQAWVDSAGNVYARGNNDVTEQDWLFRNGVVVAVSDGGDEVMPGTGEFFDDTDFGDCFFAFDGNAAGYYVFGAVTSAPSISNGVLVLVDPQGNRRVVMRENDPVDLNGNGMPDDDRFVNTFGNEDVLLMDDNSIVFTATLRDSTGTAVDQGLFRIVPTGANCALRIGSGLNPVDYTCNTRPVLGQTWTTTVATTPTTIGTFVVISAVPDPGTFVPFFNGELLIGLAPTPVVLPGTNGTHSFTIPNQPVLNGLSAFTQALRIDTPGGVAQLVLLNAIDLRLGL